MKPLVWLAAVSLFGYSLDLVPLAPGRHVLLISGATEGYLSPCGCTKPMSGGVRRRIGALRQLTVAERTTIIETGGMVAGTMRQDEMKAEALAEALGLVKVAAINYGLEEARLGAGMAASLDRLSGEALLASGLQAAQVPVKRFKSSGPFLIGGIEPRTAELGAALQAQVEPVDDTVRALLEEAKATKKAPVLMTRGDMESAVALAQRHPALKLIVCNMKSSPLEAPRKVGDTLIVSPGEHGKYIVKIEWDGASFTGYRFVDLGPEYPDDKEAQEIYTAYLSRVGREDLLAMVPRTDTDDFAGNQACISCHAVAGLAWRRSTHSKALRTLETEGHDKDPDCVGCHVVGLKSVKGFKTRQATPSLTDVGCESCHGPGKVHSMSNGEVKMGKVGEASCMTCHVPQHSPNFDFDEYWAKIKH
ncbi:MAG: multiheme c-type cytochrome [Fimbriimonadaceae bacterium]